MSINIALVGNPNCGKTTLFNLLTNSKQKVGNWSGVTVDKKYGKFLEDNTTTIIDLPGIYSLQSFTPEEKVSSDFLKKTKPDAIINVVSAVNLERSLYLTLQLLELNIPMVVAISMVDVFEKKGGKLNFAAFAKTFHCEAVPIFKNNKPSSFKEIKMAIVKAKNKAEKQLHPIYKQAVENCLNEIVSVLKIGLDTSENNLRATAIEFLENSSELENFGLKFGLNNEQQVKITNLINFLPNRLKCQNGVQSILVNERYNFIIKNINTIMVKKPNEKATVSDKIDNFLMNKWLAFPLFISIIFIIYFISIPLIGKPISSWLDETVLKAWLIPGVRSFLAKLSVQLWLTNLVCNGILAGVGSVLAFTPQLFILFSLLCVLEECGYMARITFITDKLFHKFGFCGQSVISFLVSSSCGVNGIIATKIIKNRSIRLATIVATTFVPCSAKIPIIATISSLFLTNSWLIAPLAYSISIVAILTCGLFLKNKQAKAKQNNEFFVEILPYQLPHLKHIFLDSIFNIKSFISKTMTAIFIASILIWIATNVGFVNSTIGIVQPDASILAQIGKFLIPIFKPIGFSNWQTIAATISGLFAKENIVNSLEVISASNSGGINSISELFNSGAEAFSFLIFNLLCAPCCVAIAAVFKQTNSIKTTFKIVALQTMVAFCFSSICFLILRILF